MVRKKNNRIGGKIMNAEELEYYLENEEECDEMLCNLTLDEIVDIEIELMGGF